MKSQKLSTEAIALGAILTAIVIVLQWLGGMVPVFGPFASAVALVPIVIGAAMCGPIVGAWLGAVFAVVVLLLPSTSFFWAFSVHGTFITVIVKGIACGLVAGLVYKALEKKNFYLAIILAALCCPVVNTGLFLLGCYLFFLPSVAEMAKAAESTLTGMEFFWVMATANFLTELLTTAILAPMLVRILKIKKKA